MTKEQIEGLLSRAEERLAENEGALQALNHEYRERCDAAKNYRERFILPIPVGAGRGVRNGGAKVTAPQPKRILVIDCATSGFSPQKDTILEVAVVLLDAATFQVVEYHTSAIRHAAGSVQAPDFHSALLEECANPETSNSMAAVEGFLLAGEWASADVICNRALDFDMRFLAQHMRTLHAALTKGQRPMLELKALAAINEARGGAPYVSSYPRTYRAGDEVVMAVEELLHLLGAVGRGSAL